MVDESTGQSTPTEPQEEPSSEVQTEEQEHSLTETPPDEVAESTAEPTDVLHVEETPSDEVEEPGNNLDLLMDVSLEVTVELGRREMKFSDVLQFSKGTLVALNKLADGPVDIYVNRSKVAEGEVVVIDEHFGVRITKVLNTGRLRK